jgi:YHS domain-containing protein
MSIRTIVIALVGGLGLVACESSSSTKSGTPTPTATAVSTAGASETTAPPESGGLTRVDDVSKVCMVTDQFMGTAQIPVDVAGATYFGCCEMCKARLANEPQTRTAKDPVTGADVDKAKAVIGREPSGKIHYFASAENLAKYRVP